MNSPRFIRSGKPFYDKAERYVKRGWINPLPVESKGKKVIVKGFHGYNGKLVDKAQLTEWLNDPKYDKSNIALRLNIVEIEDNSTGEMKYFQIVGIDVDHHPDDVDDPKFGGDQLKVLEKRLGELPPTWTSSARINGIAGIRFYLVPLSLDEKGKPKSLSFRGDCSEAGAPDIDIIWRANRYTVVYPSYHPLGGQYIWYPPGVAPAGIDELKDVDWRSLQFFHTESELCEIPNTNQLTVLPKKWAQWLTRDFVLDPGTVPIDMEISDKKLIEWCEKHLPKGNPCDAMLKAVAAQKVNVESSYTSHNILVKGHMNLIKLGSKDGHAGWKQAAEEFARCWADEVTRRKKRNWKTMESEINRSYMGALRKVKGKHDECAENGVAFFLGHDPCDVRISDSDDGEAPPFTVPITPAKPAEDYERNDDGNAEHFLHLYKGCLHYVMNGVQGWIIWDGERWRVDNKGYVRHLFRAVKENQIAAGERIITEGRQNADQEREKFGQSLKTWGVRSGNKTQALNALNAAQSFKGLVPIMFEELDSHRNAVGCLDKVVRFLDYTGQKNWKDMVEVIDNSRDLLITLNTEVPYIPFDEQENHPDPDIRKGYQLFMDFINRFISPSFDVDYFQKMCGTILLGEGNSKFAMFFHGITDTGKSTLATLFLKTLGDYACERNPDILKTSHLNPALATALSKRLMVIGELGDNEIQSELFKQITGGEVIPCEMKHANNIIEAIAQFTIICTTNKVPRVPGEDEAFRNRCRVLKFKHQATEKERSEKVGKRRQLELYKYGQTACLGWFVKGTARLLIEGLEPVPAEMLAATKEFVSELSEIGSFVDGWLGEEEGTFVPSEDIFFHLRTWAEINNFDMRGWTPQRLGGKLVDRGYVRGTKRVTIVEGQPKVARKGFYNIKLIRGKNEYE